MADTNSLLKAGGGATLDASIYDRQAAPPNALASYGQAAAVARQLTALDADQVDLVHKRFDGLKGIVGSLAADPSKTKQDYISAAMNAADQGFATRDQASNLIDQIRGLPDNPRALQGLGRQILLHTLNAHDRFSEVVGSPVQYNRGGSIDTMNVNRTAGTVTPIQGGSVRTTLSPNNKTEMVDSVDPETGEKRSDPKGSVFDDQGNMPRIPVYRNGRPAPKGGASGAGGDGSAAPVPSASSGGAGGDGSAPAATAQNAPIPPGPPASFVTGLGPAKAADIASSAQQFNADRADIPSSRDRVFGLVSALDAVRGTNVGPGTAGRQKILSAINALPGGVGKGLVPDGSNLSDYDIAKKYLAAAQMTRQGAGRSDAALANAQAASPNVDSMSKDAVIDVAHSMIGQERMRQAQTIAAINAKVDPGAYSNHVATTYGNSNDPKAFALGAMNADERAKYIANLKGDAKTKFFNSVRLGLSTGIISTNDLSGAAPNGQ